MKREGRQHGMVITHMVLPSPWNLRPNSRVVNKLESHPTAGSYTKVSRKPTNHSKFTGKCGRPRCEECHTHPVCKSKTKAKGMLKLKSSNGVDGMDCVGMSATETLSCLSDDYLDNDYYEDCGDDDSSQLRRSGCESDVDDGGEDGMSFCDVGFVWEQVEGDEDWCLVAEM